MKKSDARKKNEKKNTKKTRKNMFFSRKNHEMKKTFFFTTLRKRKQIPRIKNTPNDNDEGLTMLPQQHKKNQELAQSPWKRKRTLGKTNKNSPNKHDRHANENTAARRPSPTEKCDSAVIQRNEENTEVLKNEQKSRKRRMSTRKGPKGITPPGPKHTFAEKEKESCEELEPRTEPFRQQPVETLQREHQSQPTV